MTTLEKAVARECPEITNDEGRPLQATLDPEDGGTLCLKWKGLRSESGFELGLGMLMNFAEKKASGQSDTPSSSGSPSSPRPKEGSTSSAKVDKTEYVRYDDILSRIHILPNLESKERELLVATIKKMRDHQEDLAKG